MIDTLVAALVLDSDRQPPVSRSAPSAAVSFLRCVVAHESHGNPRAENPTSTASGLFQWIDSSWQYASRKAGYPGWSHASHAPARVQWAVSLWFVTHEGHHPWRGTHCGYNT